MLAPAAGSLPAHADGPGSRARAAWKPPRGTDGTPNESVADVLVRVRQVRGRRCGRRPSPGGRASARACRPRRRLSDSLLLARARARSRRHAHVPASRSCPGSALNAEHLGAVQVLSVTETQYSNSTVVIIAPDSENLSVLQARTAALTNVEVMCAEPRATRQWRSMLLYY
jgi:hypothetical protein